LNKNYRGTSDSLYKGFNIQQGENGKSITKIMNGLLFFLKWMLSRHNKVAIFRLDVFPADTNLDISRFNQSFLGCLRRGLKYSNNVDGTQAPIELSWKRTKLFWIRERGTSKYNKGIHYHLVLAIPISGDVQLNKIGFIIKDRANHYLRAGLDLPENYTFPSEDETNIDYDKKPHCSYRGFFGLDRRYIKKHQSDQQKQEIEQALSKDSGYRYLDVSAIKKRTHNNKQVLGGVLVECIYALSYLAKLKTKDNLDRSDRTFTAPKYIDDVKVTAARLKQIAKHKGEVEEAFDSYAQESR
jgi:hypothetical protein